LGDLPENVLEMTLEQRVEFIEAKRAERESIQRRIQEASAEREAFVQEAFAKSIGDSELGAEMRKTIREQAMAKGFTRDGC
jgi:hypothetical protein